MIPVPSIEDKRSLPTHLEVSRQDCTREYANFIGSGIDEVIVRCRKTIELKVSFIFEMPRLPQEILMKTRSLFLAIAAGLLVSGTFAFDARAGQVDLPTALSSLEGAGNYAIVGNLEFSDFTYTPTPMGATPTASGVTVKGFTAIPGETGITFNAGFYAAAGTIVDYSITYKVTALSGTISDAYLAIAGGNFGGTGSVDVGETITKLDGTSLGTMDAFIPGSGVSTPLTFAPQTSILVNKDIFLIGGSNGVTVSIINQGFSSTAVPEPTSMALLGIGMTSFLAFRRFFKRATIA
jgi:hypothetical protein